MFFDKMDWIFSKNTIYNEILKGDIGMFMYNTNSFTRFTFSLFALLMLNIAGTFGSDITAENQTSLQKIQRFQAELYKIKQQQAAIEAKLALIKGTVETVIDNNVLTTQRESIFNALAKLKELEEQKKTVQSHLKSAIEEHLHKESN
jgi:uncharacterized protein YhaN